LNPPPALLIDSLGGGEGRVPERGRGDRDLFELWESPGGGDPPIISHLLRYFDPIFLGGQSYFPPLFRWMRRRRGSGH